MVNTISTYSGLITNPVPLETQVAALTTNVNQITQMLQEIQARLNNGEGLNQRKENGGQMGQHGGQNGNNGGNNGGAYGRLTKIEFPKFEEVSGEGLDNEEDEDMQLIEEGVMSTYTTSLIYGPPLISLNALTGENSYRTMRVKAHVRKNVVHTLVDCGSTHNFQDWNIARKLGCKLRKMCPLEIFVANGMVMSSKYTCKDFSWEFQGVTYTTDVMILPLRGCEMVLGI
nr:transposon Ty3-I Gag-Pol polyprotein [Tanacetum cinerariifolium]